MTEVKEIPRSWFFENGPEQDVVISSRIRLSRNLATYRFPGFMNKQEEKQLLEEVGDLFEGYKQGDGFQIVNFHELSALERRLFLERNLVSKDFSDRSNSVLLLREDGLLSTTLGDIDHLRISSILGGMDLHKAYEEVDSIDLMLDENLEYAVSLEWGYLSSEITNLGTGLRASVMLHLPGLVSSSYLESVFKSVCSDGFTIKGFFSEQEGSLGNIYQISNQWTIGISEKEIIEKLESGAQQLVHYERKAREEILEARRVEVQDAVFRAYGILKYARSISYQEAITLLSSLRFGWALGLIHEVSVETITALLFLTQKWHVIYSVGDEEEDKGASSLPWKRAQLIRYYLDKDTGHGGIDV